MRRFVLATVGSLVLAGAFAAGAAPQEPRPTFAARTDLIQLDVSVLDHNRLPVRGLTASDFTVVVDGKPQPIVAFGAVDLPPRLVTGASWLRNVAPDVATNRADAQRIVVLVLDDAHTPFDPGIAAFTRRIAQATIDQLGPSDRAAVVYTHARKNGQEFTLDRTRLTAAVGRFTPAGQPAQPFGPFSAERSGLASAAAARPLASGICVGGANGDCLMEALQNAADILRDNPGTRKTLVLVSPMSYHIAGDAIDSLDTASALTRLFSALQQANINVYEFDPRGLTPSFDPDYGDFSNNTGGRAITATNEPWSLVPQVFRENSSYYLLGVQPADRREDGRFHRITVNVSRPDLEVRSRNGYFAPRPARPSKPSKGTAVTAADRAIARGLPSGDLPMRLSAAPLFAPGERRARLAIAAGLDLPTDTPLPASLALVVTAFSDTWKAAGTARQTITIDGAHPSPTGVLDVWTRLDLPAGRYELRAALEEPRTGRTGSAFLSVTIPDFTKAPLALSGVVLGAHGSTPARDTPLSGVVPTRPTTRREFAQTEAVDTFLQIRQGGSKAIAPVALTMRVVDSEGRDRWRETTTVMPAQFAADRQAEIQIPLPLGRLDPGEYLLSLEAAAGGVSDQRDVRFTVR